MKSARARRLAVLLPLFCLAAWLALFGDKSPSGPAAEVSLAVASPVSRPAPVKAERTTAKQAQLPSVELLLPREQLVVAAASAPVDLFASRSWVPPPAPMPVQVVAAPTPVAPPLPYVYMGKKFEDGAWEVYLARGELSFVVRAGNDLEGLYRVLEVRPPILTLKYLPLGEQQLLAIGENQ